ncbi:hypothetical protein TNCV_3532031 [Trichonephila clavipes]|nr:hypothetical protein TNCV_3532031 [Trichonephila clavipes]
MSSSIPIYLQLVCCWVWIKRYRFSANACVGSTTLEENQTWRLLYQIWLNSPITSMLEQLKAVKSRDF